MVFLACMVYIAHRLKVNYYGLSLSYKKKVLYGLSCLYGLYCSLP